MNEENELENTDKNLPVAEFTGDLKIGDADIPCAVLSDGRRILSETGITNALLGGRSGALASSPELKPSPKN
ncbi:MAG: hypothetical protein ACI8ZW_000321 [Yoonia sp.]|jgi:hypothetical protein